MIHWSFSFADRIGGAKCFGDVCLGGSDCLLGPRPEMSPQSNARRESATGSVGRGGGDLFTRQPALFPRRRKQEVIRLAEMATSDHHVQLVIAQSRCHLFELEPPPPAPAHGPRSRIIAHKDGQFVNVRCDPANAMEQFVSDNANAIRIDERSSRSRTQHRIEHNPFPRDVAGLRRSERRRLRPQRRSFPTSRSLRRIGTRPRPGNPVSAGPGWPERGSTARTPRVDCTVRAEMQATP